MVIGYEAQEKKVQNMKRPKPESPASGIIFAWQLLLALHCHFPSGTCEATSVFMAVMAQFLLVLCVVAVVMHASSAFQMKPGRVLQRGPLVKTSLKPNSLSSTLRYMNMKSDLSVGIVGATGAVGEEILSVMEQRKFPASSVKLFASEKSAGKTIKSSFYGDLNLEAFAFDVASKLDVVLLAVGGDFSLEWGEKLAQAGVLVIDNSSAFRLRPDVPLVVPEINIKAAKGKKLIANPNCTTAIALMALAPIHKRFKIKKAIISTYQAASGAGAPGMTELLDGMASVVNGKEVVNKVFAHPLPNNLIPHIDVFQANQYTKEEMKVTWETKKIMDAPDMKISVTAVRIPTLRAHSEAITIETEEKISAKEVRDILSKSPGVKVVDDPANKKYPMPLTATKQWDVEVGRIRENDVFGEYGLDLFVCGDQVCFSLIIIKIFHENFYPNVSHVAFARCRTERCNYCGATSVMKLKNFASPLIL